MIKDSLTGYPAQKVPALVVFSHGKESGPWGSKIQTLAEIARRHGANVESIDYSDTTDPDQRVTKLLSTPLPKHSILILVGSSMGGYVSTIASASLKPKGLFLLAPAFKIEGYKEQNPAPCAEECLIVHGWRDEVIPPENSFEIAKRHSIALHILDGDHRLNSSLEQVAWLFDEFMRRVLMASNTSL